MLMAAKRKSLTDRGRESDRNNSHFYIKCKQLLSLHHYQNREELTTSQRKILMMILDLNIININWVQIIKFHLFGIINAIDLLFIV